MKNLASLALLLALTLVGCSKENETADADHAEATTAAGVMPGRKAGRKPTRARKPPMW